eukprot:c6970_g1_i1.p1 GENE.c6970_g1_i1~~c6970_g1_i1.p1  ORF type:complete len:458 (+),score=67.22 c6970_g1_i1:39-1412(+)
MEHVSVVFCGDVSSGKSTIIGRLLFELGCIPESDLNWACNEAMACNLPEYLYAMLMARHLEELYRGLSFCCSERGFSTNKYRFSVIDVPGHRKFLKSAILGISSADIAVLVINSNSFHWSIQKFNVKLQDTEGIAREHARLCNAFGIKQLIVAVNQLIFDSRIEPQVRYNEVCEATRAMLVEVGWPKDFIETSVPFIPMAKSFGDNLIKKSNSLQWWNGIDVKLKNESIAHVETLLGALNDMADPPKRDTEKPFRFVIDGAYKIRGVGQVLTGTVVQGVILPNTEIEFLPQRRAVRGCVIKIFSIEMHNQRITHARAGDRVGFNIVALQDTPHIGDVMIKSGDDSIKLARRFMAEVQTLNISDQVKRGYCPIGFVQTNKAPCKLIDIVWKKGEETAWNEVSNPEYLKSNELAQVTFVPQVPFVVDTAVRCEGLSRIVFSEKNSIVMTGKIIYVEFIE